MNVLDLFSGIGGFSLGLERAGMRTVAFCEIDPYCRDVLAKHWPAAELHADVTQRGFVEGEADVITAGFPCQDISYAGEGAGLAGARSGLYRHVIRALRLVRPRFAVLENVSALLSRGLDTVLGDMAEVGYDAEWHCIPASAVGAPHRRDRIWIIADAGSEQHESSRPPFSGALAEELSRAYPDADSQGHDANAGFGSDTSAAGETEGQEDQRQWVRDAVGRVCPPMADASSAGLQGPGHVGSEAGGWSPAGQSLFSRPSDGRQWLVEPNVGRVAHGVPARVDRLRSLGNSVVPQIPEIIGRAIMMSIIHEENNDA
jgi:DNA (cytosine-5)-methyltransferase 1